MQKPADIWMPALMAGAIFGFLSGIPLVNFLNCACCSLIVGAGVLAAWLVYRASPPEQPLTYGRAALAGMLAGLVAAPVESATSFVGTVLLQGASPADQMNETFDRLSQYMPDAAEASRVLQTVPITVWLVLGMFVLAVIFAPFGALGGVIGRALFEKRAAPPPAPYGAPPPVPYGAPPGGGGPVPPAGPAIQP